MKSSGKSPIAGKSGTTLAGKTAARRVPTETGAEVVKRQPLESHVFDVADAIAVHRAVVNNFAALKARGVTDGEVAAFAAQIELGKQVEGTGGRLSLDAVRQTAKDLAGDYRTAADLVCITMDGRDAALATTLLCDGRFPDNDVDLDRYLGDLGAPLAAHSDALARRGFPVAAQVQLGEAAAKFHVALAQRPENREALDAEVANRQAVLRKLRAQTRYMRTVGRAATKRTAARAEFDRPRPETAGARAQAAANKATAQQRRAEAQAARAAAKAAQKTARAEAAAAKKAGRKKG